MGFGEIEPFSGEGGVILVVLVVELSFCVE